MYGVDGMKNLVEKYFPGDKLSKLIYFHDNLIYSIEKIANFWGVSLHIKVYPNSKKKQLGRYKKSICFMKHAH